jgi:AraC-like DNA-binding protein
MDPRRTRTFRGQDPQRRWELALHTLPAPLAPYVLDCCGYREWTEAVLVRRELPIARIVLVLDLGPPIEVGGQRHRAGFVAGLTDQLAVHRYARYQEGIQLMLTPVGARALLGLPLVELAQRVVALEDLLPGEAAALVAQLQQEPAWAPRFARLEAWLAHRLASRAPDPVVGWACAQLQQARGALPIRQLGQQAGYSERQLIRRFLEHVGIGPKRYARLVRFDALMAQLRAAPRERDWGGLAVRFGYADQSHLVREVRQFTGTTPTALETLLEPFGPGAR